MRLTGPVVWILAEDHHLRVGVAGQREGSEDLVAGRVHVVMSAFISHAPKKAAPVRFFELRLELSSPVGLTEDLPIPSGGGTGLVAIGPRDSDVRPLLAGIRGLCLPCSNVRHPRVVRVDEDASRSEDVCRGEQRVEDRLEEVVEVRWPGPVRPHEEPVLDQVEHDVHRELGPLGRHEGLRESLGDLLGDRHPPRGLARPDRRRFSASHLNRESHRAHVSADGLRPLVPQISGTPGTTPEGAMVVRFVDMDDAWEQDTISELKGALDKAAVDPGLECRLRRLVVDRTNPFHRLSRVAAGD